MIVGGWFGEFSFWVSWLRAITDIWNTGFLSATPIIRNFDWMYGFSWGVGFTRGAIVDIVTALMFLLTLPIGWILYEYYKGK